MKTVDPIAARELALTTINDGDIYRQQVVPLLHQLAKHVRKGDYCPVKALACWERVAKAGADLYRKEFGYSFPTATRKAAALELQEHYEEQFRGMLL